jgi:hypothetical protein
MARVAYITTWGSVRQSCYHRHRTYDTALACAEADGRGCRQWGGYSDRTPIVVTEDGDWVPAWELGDVHIGSVVPDDETAAVSQDMYLGGVLYRLHRR